MNTKKSRVLAIFVTYYPSRELLIDNIKKIETHVDKIIIWENTPQQNAIDYRFYKSEKIEYCHSEKNSISVALNYALNYSIKYGYNYLLTMDQDSCFDNFFLFKEKAIEKLIECKSMVYPERNCSTLKNDFVYVYDAEAITSGMLVDVNTIQSIGGYCEDFDVDAIDVDLCAKLLFYGFPIVQYRGANLIQRFGASKKGNILGKHISVYDYNPTRLYNIFKNHIVVYRRYRKPNYLLVKIICYLQRFFISILFFEDKKKSKMKSIIIGIKDGCFCKIYPIVDKIKE